MKDMVDLICGACTPCVTRTVSTGSMCIQPLIETSLHFIVTFSWNIIHTGKGHYLISLQFEHREIGRCWLPLYVSSANSLTFMILALGCFVVALCNCWLKFSRRVADAVGEACSRLGLVAPLHRLLMCKSYLRLLHFNTHTITNTKMTNMRIHTLAKPPKLMPILLPGPEPHSAWESDCEGGHGAGWGQVWAYTHIKSQLQQVTISEDVLLKL